MQKVVQLFHPSGTLYENFKAFSNSHPHASWFQSDHFFRFALQWKEATPVLLIALQEEKLKDPGAHYLSKQSKQNPAYLAAKTRQNMSGTGKDQPGTTSSMPLYGPAEDATPQTDISRQTNPVSGSLLAVILHQQSRRGMNFWPLKQINKPFATQTVVYGGPLLADDTRLRQEVTLKTLIHALQSMVAGSSLFTQFVNFSDMGEHTAVFRASGFKRFGHRNLIIDSSSYNNAWRNLSNTIRQQVKESLDNGARVVTKPNTAQIDRFCQLLHAQNKKQSGGPLPSQGFFRSLAEKQHAAAFLIITHNEKVIGGTVCPILQGKAMHSWYLCGQDDEHRHLHVYPGALAIWSAIAHAADSGTPTIDFLRVCNIEEKFKATNPETLFGGKWVGHGSFARTNKKLFFAIAKRMAILRPPFY